MEEELLVNLLSVMLRYDYNGRATAGQDLESPWFCFGIKKRAKIKASCCLPAVFMLHLVSWLDQYPWFVLLVPCI